jgi:hypothetical protein
MTLRFPALALALAFAAGCGGQIDTSVFETNGDASSPVEDSTTTTSDTAVTTTPPAPDALPAQEAATPPGTGTTGSACASSSECASGICFRKHCTTTCSSKSDCIAGWYCSTQAQGSICNCNPTGPDCGGLDKNCDGKITSTAPCATPTSDAGPQPSDGGTLNCSTCAQSSCASEAYACYQDTTCGGFLNCVQNCATIPSSCTQQCQTKYNDQATQTFVSCMVTNCAGCQ